MVISPDKMSLIVLVWFAVGHVYVSAGQTLNSQELINHLEQSLNAGSRLEMQIKEQVFYHGGEFFPREKLVEECQISLRRNDELWRIDVQDQGTTITKGEEMRYAEHLQFIVTSEGTIHAQVDPQTRLPAQVPVLTATVTRPIDTLDIVLDYVRNGSLLFGYLSAADKLSLPQLLRNQPQQSVEMVQLEARPVFLLKTQGKYGIYRLWLDPQVGYLPRRIEVSKGPSDYFGSGRTVSSYETSRNSGIWPADTKLKGYSQVDDQFQIEQINDVPFITALSRVEVYEYDNGQSANFRSQIETQNVNLSPSLDEDADFTITLEIPNGTSVYVDDAPNISYHWKDGGLVKTVDYELLTEIEQISFLGMQTSRKSILILLNLFVIAIIMAFIYHRYRKRKTDQLSM